MLDKTLLAQALADPAIKPLSDADAATALSAGTVGTRVETLTFTVLSRADVWGFAKSATYQTSFAGAVAAAQTSNATVQQQQVGAIAAMLLQLLGGNGISPTDPQVPAVVTQIVGAQLVAQADANAAVNQTTYRCGAPVATADVTAARALIAANANAAKLRGQVLTANAAVIALLNAYATALAANPSTAVAPTAGQLNAAFAAKVVG